VLSQNVVHEGIGLLDLDEPACPRNNDGTGVKGTDGNLLALAESSTVAVPHTQGLTAGTHSLYSFLGGCLIVVVLRITPLINGRLEGTEQVILTHQKLMQLLAID